MRKLLLLSACLMSICLSQINAQEKSLKATPAKITYHTPASKAASLDSSVQEFISEKTEEMLFLKKNVCTVTGTVTFDTLEYCSKSKKFIPITPIKEVQSPCVRAKNVYSTQTVKAPVVGKQAKFEYLKAQKAACSSASTKIKSQRGVVKKEGQ